MALIYTQLGDNDKALQAYKDARASNPDDVNLILNEANLHYQMGDKDKFKELMAEAASVAPDNPDLHNPRNELPLFVATTICWSRS
jgi:tetratricopeptide (TPR) repeat protein